MYGDISHVPALLTFDIQGYAGRDVLLIVLLILVVQSCDVLQYIWGGARWHARSPRLGGFRRAGILLPDAFRLDVNRRTSLARVLARE